MQRSRLAFTLIELVVVISIILILAALLAPIISIALKTSRETAARGVMDSIVMGLGQYYNECDAFPPDDPPGMDSNECLTYYLTSNTRKGDRRVGGYLPVNERMSRDSDGDGKWELYSPMGGKYEYRLLHGQGSLPICIVIDPGHDMKLGGSMDPAVGFVPDGSGADKDNVARTIQR
jgi:prepilin-type N-terminal cleavage/methylation domain-containing protein